MWNFPPVVYDNFFSFSFFFSWRAPLFSKKNLNPSHFHKYFNLSQAASYEYFRLTTMQENCTFAHLHGRFFPMNNVVTTKEKTVFRQLRRQLVERETVLLIKVKKKNQKLNLTTCRSNWTFTQSNKCLTYYKIAIYVVFFSSSSLYYYFHFYYYYNNCKRVVRVLIARIFIPNFEQNT